MRSLPVARRLAVLLALVAVAGCSDAPTTVEETVIVDYIRLTPLTLSLRVARDTLETTETVGATIVARNDTKATIVEPGLFECPLGVALVSAPPDGYVQVQLPAPKVGPPRACGGTIDLRLAPGDSIVQEVALHPVTVIGGDGIGGPAPGRYTVTPVLVTLGGYVRAGAFRTTTLVVR